jgi:UDP-glucose 4-epimerase
VTAFPEAIVLFGASGFVGRNMVDAWRGKTARLIAVTGSGKPVPGCTETIAMDEIVRLGALPADTVVVHVAASRYDAGRFDLAQSDIIGANARLNTGVYHCCAERGIKEVRLASSVAVYGAGLPVMDDAVPVDLNTEPNRNEAFYAWSKRWAETLAHIYHDRFGINSIVLRLSNPYGPYDSMDPKKAHVAPAFVMKALSHAPEFEILGDPIVGRDFTYVGDVVRVFEHTLTWRGRQETYNLCTGRTRSLQELAETVMRLAGVDKPIRAGAPGAFGPAERISRGDRIRAATGIDFADIETGMRPTIAWYANAYRE